MDGKRRQVSAMTSDMSSAVTACASRSRSSSPAGSRCCERSGMASSHPGRGAKPQPHPKVVKTPFENEMGQGPKNKDVISAGGAPNVRFGETDAFMRFDNVRRYSHLENLCAGWHLNSRQGEGNSSRPQTFASEHLMLDTVMLALGASFFAAGIGYAYACERL